MFFLYKCKIWEDLQKDFNCSTESHIPAALRRGLKQELDSMIYDTATAVNLP